MLPNSVFKLSHEVTPGILQLLAATVLGTNGAQYRHLDTAKRIHLADHPLFLSIVLKEKTIGNVTFCQRGNDWYIRYFAFSASLQSGKKPKRSTKGNSILKGELKKFFDDCFSGKITDQPIQSMYAYIDPKNDRSKWMSEFFGFSVIGQLATQSFSRVYPKRSFRLERIDEWEEVNELVHANYAKHNYFSSVHIQTPPFYVLRDENKKVIAMCHVTHVNWEIVRLPGKFGGILTWLVPYLPPINKLIRPKKHTFLVPDVVWVKNNDPKLLEELFSAILYTENEHVMMWWLDSRDPIYLALKSKVKWGLLDKLLGNNPVDIVQRTNPQFIKTLDSPNFVSAFDMV